MENKISYLKLTDKDNYGTIIKRVGMKSYGFINGEWKCGGMSIGYFFPDAPDFDCYEEISEEEAFHCLGIG